MTKLPRIYLAGPGVFRPDAVRWGDHLKQLCNAHGLEGCYPLDQAIPAGVQGKAVQRQWIFANNCDLIRQADAVFADLRAFRSICEPDSGTVFEVGFAHALGKPVYLWLPDGEADVDMIQRFGAPVDAQGLALEDFDAPINLMIWEAAAGISYQPEPDAAIAELATFLRHLE